MSLLERPLKLLELGRREGGSDATLLSLLGQHCVVAGIDFVGEAGWKLEDKLSVFKKQK